MTTLNILHLEDDADLRKSIRDILKVLVPEANVQQFSTSDEALQYVLNGNPEVNLFLLDVRVPGRFNGIGLAHRLRELGYTSTIAFCSAYAKPSLPGDLNYTWLQKPTGVEDFVRITQAAQAEKMQP